MDLKIPLETRRFHPDVIEELIGKGFFDDVERPKACKVTYLDYQGQPQELDCDGLLATCIQHEMDHLNGVVFLDHLSRLKRDMIVKKQRR